MLKTTKNITILGSTGSIGTQALEVLENFKNKELFNIIGLSCGNNIELLIKQIRKFHPKKVCTGTYEGAKTIKSLFPEIKVFNGDDGLIELASDKDIDIMLTGTSGYAGLKPTLKAIRNGKDIALANKETLVMAGDIIMEEAKKANVRILPVDSEHSAILQSSNGKIDLLNKIIITASGGPFLHKTLKEMEKAKCEDALNHPRWNMGKKITIDCATLMNKGLEVIEAHHLFNLPYEKIEVVIHPQSIVHSAVEFKDGSIVAQLGVPSMHIPIQYALTYPDRQMGIKTGSFSFFGQNLTFEKPDLDKFPCLKLAFNAGKIGGTMPAVLNAANEAAVKKFLKGEIKLMDIYKIVEAAMENHKPILNPSLEEIFAVDKEIRKKI